MPRTRSGGAVESPDRREALRQQGFQGSRMRGWKSYPWALLDDPCVRAHHHSIALAVLGLTSISVGRATGQQCVGTAAGLTSRAVGRLAGVSDGNAGTYLADLERFGHLDLEWSGRKITGIAWNEQHLAALCLQDPFIRVPAPILCDYSLPSPLKHTYVALRWAEFRYPQGSEFIIAVTTLADLTHASRNTVRKRLGELRGLHLIEPGTGRPRNQMAPLRFVPLEVRYARIDRQAKQLIGGLPTHLPLVDHDRRYERFVQHGRRIEKLVWPLGEEAPPSLQVVEELYWGPIVRGSNQPADPTEPTWRSTTSNLEDDPSNFQADRSNFQVDPTRDAGEGGEEKKSLDSPRRARMNVADEGNNSKPKTAQELVDYLRAKLREQHAGLDDPGWVPEVKTPAVGDRIRAMLDDGVEPEVIQEMIDIFTASQVYHRPGSAPWLMFLHHKPALLEKARKSTEARRADMGDPSDWLGPPAEQDGSKRGLPEDDPSHWTGLPEGQGRLSGSRRRV
jgi:hypothetical protein